MTATLHPTGNRIADTCHAARPAIEHGCTWVTLDRGFSAYSGLRLLDLLDVNAA